MINDMITKTDVATRNSVVLQYGKFLLYYRRGDSPWEWGTRSSADADKPA